jgi:hypothetical protein
MSIYTVHEPPLRSADASAETERFVFVRDGFYWWAFLLTPLWMLRHRLWLVLAIYLVGMAAFDAVLSDLGISAFLIALICVLISLLIGFEASTLRRLTLRRRGWRNVGVVAGDRLDDAERRFFDVWVGNAPARPAAPPPSPPPASAAPDSSGVIGLFPEPGGAR